MFVGTAEGLGGEESPGEGKGGELEQDDGDNDGGPVAKVIGGVEGG